MWRALLCLAAAVLPQLAVAQSAAGTYPGKPLRWILGYPAGGVSDILARPVGQRLAEVVGQQVIIDNRPGASGIVASEIAAKAPADGYTLMLGETSTHSVNVSLYSKLPYDPVKDFVPVSLLAESPLVVVVRPNLGVNSVQELIELARQKSLDYASGGTGTGMHLTSELFKSVTSTRLRHIPYKGTPLAITDLLGGRVDLMIPNLPPVMNFIKSGRMHAIAVTSAQPLGSLPDLPTVAQTVTGFVSNTWYGLFVPAGTPASIVATLNAAVAKVLNEPDVRERLSAVGFEVKMSTPEELSAYQRSEIAKWHRVIETAGITPE
jgi:tripartite-type tricarboxylate transporter receptor subunit TctC